jgi:hypothetical protein
MEQVEVEDWARYGIQKVTRSAISPFIYYKNIHGGLNYHKAMSLFWGATVPMGLRLPFSRKPSQAGMIAERTHRRPQSYEESYIYPERYDDQMEVI